MNKVGTFGFLLYINVTLLSLIATTPDKKIMQTPDCQRKRSAFNINVDDYSNLVQR